MKMFQLIGCVLLVALLAVTPALAASTVYVGTGTALKAVTFDGTSFSVPSASAGARNFTNVAALPNGNVVTGDSTLSRLTQWSFDGTAFSEVRYVGANVKDIAVGKDGSVFIMNQGPDWVVAVQPNGATFDAYGMGMDPTAKIAVAPNRDVITVSNSPAWVASWKFDDVTHAWSSNGTGGLDGCNDVTATTDNKVWTVGNQPQWIIRWENPPGPITFNGLLAQGIDAGSNGDVFVVGSGPGWLSHWYFNGTQPVYDATAGNDNADTLISVDPAGFIYTAGASGKMRAFSYDAVAHSLSLRAEINMGEPIQSIDAIPEPATMLLLGLGSVALLRRRRA